MSKILVVRHGETPESRRSVVQGQSDTCLTEVGVRQAIAMGEYLNSNYSISSIVSSDLKRAVQTAEVIASELRNGAPCLQTSELRELSLGDLEGAPMQSLLEFRERDARGVELSAPSGGESLADLRHRVLAWFFAYAESVDGCALVVTHHGPISVLLDSARPSPTRADYQLALDHRSITIFEVTSTRRPAYLTVERAFGSSGVGR